MYKVSLSPIKCILKHPHQKVFGERLCITLEVKALEDFQSLDKGFQDLLGGKVLLSSKDPLLPVFQVLESLGILDLVLFESLDLPYIAKTLGNIIKNYKPECFKLELTVGDKLRYAHSMGVKK
jgi:hypothetical protein